MSGDVRFAQPAAIYNRIQLAGFCVQESVVYCTYLYEAVRNRMYVARTRGRERRHVITHLICVSGFV